MALGDLTNRALGRQLREQEKITPMLRTVAFIFLASALNFA
jgi:hypothetical protein